MIFKRNNINRPFDWNEVLDEILPRDFLSPITTAADLAEYIMATDHNAPILNMTYADANPVLVAQWMIRDAITDDDYPNSLAVQSWIFGVPEVQQAVWLRGVPGKAMAHEIALCAATLVRKGAA